MNYSKINDFKNKQFVSEPDKLYRSYPNNVPLQNYNNPAFENSGVDNWGSSIHRAILNGTVQSTPIGELFFSRENIRRIQNQIKKEVFIRTNGKYVLEVDQKESDLLVVMRAVFISDSYNSPYKIVHQVKLLNHKTVERIIPDMISVIKMDEKYLYDISNPINPIPLPVNVSKRGLKSLPSITTTYNF
jgi:Family of unknown function (DUF5761)